MFQVTRKDNNRLDILFSGKLDSDGMRAALDDLVNNAEGIEHGHMLCRVGDFDMPTLGAIGVELSRLPSLFRLMRQFDKVAVIAGQGWIRKTSEIEGALIPGLKIKGFDLDDEVQAELWLES